MANDPGNRSLCVLVAGPHTAGKTTYLEHLLLRRALVDRLGRVEDGTSHLDTEPEEVRHGFSLALAVATVPTAEGTLFLLDCPGEADLVAEQVGARSIADLALIFAAADAEPARATLEAFAWARTMGVPALLALSRLDHPNARFEEALERSAQVLGTAVLPLALPDGAGEGLSGLVDLVTFERHGPGHTRAPAGDAARQAAAEARQRLEEAAADADERLLDRYIEREALTDEDLRGALGAIATHGPLLALPVCAPMDLGVDLLAETLWRMAPGRMAPESLNDDADRETNGNAGRILPAADGQAVARIFKTMADPYVGRLSLLRVLRGELHTDLHVRVGASGHEERLGQLFRLVGRRQTAVASLGTGEVGAVARLGQAVTGDGIAAAGGAPPPSFPPLVFPEPRLRMAVTTTQTASDDKLGPALARLMEEDPSLKSRTDPETDELLLEGLGETHLEVTIERLGRKFGVAASLARPSVPYRETVRAHARAEGRHKKQSGGHGQFGHVWLEVEPLTDGEFAFVDKIFGGVVPQQYRPAVEKGVREAMRRGVVAGYPVTGVRVTLTDGSYHSVDSSEMAFKIAAAMAFEKACREARPVLLEPVLEVQVEAPEAYAGAIIDDLQKRRARILGLDPGGGRQRIRAHAPEAEMLRYASDLRSLTGGWGTFTARQDHYAEAPPQVVARVVEGREGTHAAAHA